MRHCEALSPVHVSISVRVRRCPMSRRSTSHPNLSPKPYVIARSIPTRGLNPTAVRHSPSLYIHSPGIEQNEITDRSVLKINSSAEQATSPCVQSVASTRSFYRLFPPLFFPHSSAYFQLQNKRKTSTNFS
jgi:hypothetical protein